MGNDEEEQEKEDKDRRSAELEALLAIYEEEAVQVSTTRDYQSDRDVEVWKILVAAHVQLELQLPVRYPSREAPTPRIHAPQYILNEGQTKDLISELKELWTVDTEVAVLWAEHCRVVLEEQLHDDPNTNNNSIAAAAPDALPTSTEEPEEPQAADGTFTFTPPTSKFGQPVRHFDLSVIQNDANRCHIHHGPTFRPPKSGSSETLVAHVATVTSMDQVHWVLAELLSDKKIAKASHNMIAYRLTDTTTGRNISDNDDDGEKGSGAKLAALLELTNVNNVIVVVSRWYGGIQLGPARFKWFASVARDALEEFGYLT